VVDGGAPGTPIGEDQNLAVMPNGVMYVFSYDGRARVFSPDGAMQFASEAARRDDEYRARRRAEED
jgi:hypothetical protein